VSFKKWKLLMLISIFVVALSGWTFFYSSVRTQMQIITDTFKVVLDKAHNDVCNLGLRYLLTIKEAEVSSEYLFKLCRAITKRCVRVSIYDVYTGTLVSETSLPEWSRHEDLQGHELPLLAEGTKVDNSVIIPLYITPKGQYFTAQVVKQSGYYYVFVFAPELPIESFLNTCFKSRTMLYSLAFAIDDIYLYKGKGFHTPDLKVLLYTDHFKYYLLIDVHAFFLLLLLLIAPMILFFISFFYLRSRCLQF